MFIKWGKLMLTFYFGVWNEKKVFYILETGKKEGEEFLHIERSKGTI